MRTRAAQILIPGLHPEGCAGRAPLGARPNADVPSFRLWVWSDLRLDSGRDALPSPPPGCDAVLVAGNIGIGLAASVRRLAKALDGVLGSRVIAYVPGILEFTDGMPVPEALAEAAPVARDLGISLLHDTSVRIAGPDRCSLHVVGAVLWPNFAAAPGRDQARTARQHARERWRLLARVSAGSGIRFEPHDAVAAHARSVAYLQDALASVAVGAGGFGRGHRSLVPDARPGDKTVVLTAFPPSKSCLPPALARPLLDPIAVAWLASDLDADLERWSAPAAWVHGSVPHGSDFRLGATRIVSNPVDFACPDNGGDPTRTILV